MGLFYILRNRTVYAFASHSAAQAFAERYDHLGKAGRFISKRQADTILRNDPCLFTRGHQVP